MYVVVFYCILLYTGKLMYCIVHRDTMYFIGDVLHCTVYQRCIVLYTGIYWHIILYIIPGA